MADLRALFILLVSAIGAIAVALVRARRTGRTEATRTIQESEARHADQIAANVAKARADRRVVETHRPAVVPDAGDTPPVRLRGHAPLGDRGWRD